MFMQNVIENQAKFPRKPGLSKPHGAGRNRQASPYCSSDQMGSRSSAGLLEMLVKSVPSAFIT